jgi:outer membrane protein OmpA-like peptidoglycan-associated protein
MRPMQRVVVVVTLAVASWAASGHSVVARPSGASSVVVDQGKIVILQHCWFAAGRSDIDRPCKELLRAASVAMQEHPEITKLSIEGHASVKADGNDAMSRFNVAMHRARSVHDLMIANGVAIDRLTMVAFGSDRPLEGGSSIALARNRRVELRVIAVNGKPQ